MIHIYFICTTRFYEQTFPAFQYGSYTKRQNGKIVDVFTNVAKFKNWNEKN